MITVFCESLLQPPRAARCRGSETGLISQVLVQNVTLSIKYMQFLFGQTAQEKKCLFATLMVC